jgi:GNAT superfamily N-acetyltransferase
VIVRRVLEPDLEALVDLCSEHASFEGAAYEREGKSERLRALLFSTAPRLLGWIAVRDSTFLGYTTATIDVSTWNAQPFMHMDCLFVRTPYRNHGIGLRLMMEVVRESRRRSLLQMQWQTPRWNIEADRFYRRLNAEASEKYRYCLSVEHALQSLHTQ